jgi:hypothetical protein
MGEYDRFACRLLLLALLLRRRAVMPPIECGLPFMRKALQARHLRGMEVGCGEQRQCVWLPYPHHIEPWCAGLDWLWDSDYKGLLAGDYGKAASADLKASTAKMPVDAWQLVKGAEAAAAAGVAGNASRLLAARDPPQNVLVLDGEGSKAAAGKRGKKAAEPLGWIPLGGFRVLEWRAPFPRRVEKVMRSSAAEGGLGLSDSQVNVVKGCLRSLATSKE